LLNVKQKFRSSCRIAFDLVLTLLVYIPGVIHALFIVNKYYADQRTKRLEKAIRETGQQG